LTDDVEHCYRVYARMPDFKYVKDPGHDRWQLKRIVWITDRQLTIESLKNPNYTFKEITDAHTLAQYERYRLLRAKY
jgi:hypothetical protein